MKWRLDYGLDSRTIRDRQHTRALPFTGYIFGASVSEPHSSEFNCNFSYMYIHYCYYIIIFCLTSFRIIFNSRGSHAEGK